MRCEISILRDFVETYIGVSMPETAEVLRVQYLRLQHPQRALAVPPYGADACRIWAFPDISAQQLIRLVPELVVRGCGFQLCVEAGCLVSETRWRCSRQAATASQRACPICGHAVTNVRDMDSAAYNGMRAGLLGLALPTSLPGVLS
jgi:hypothetical protein